MIFDILNAIPDWVHMGHNGKDSKIQNEVNNLRGFKLGHLNITSLPKHVDELRLQLINQPIDIFSINETRLDDSIDNGLINISGYEILRKDRNRMGGGVAIYYRDNLNVVNRNELVPESLEAVCIEVRKPKSKPFLIVSLYCPPNSRQQIFNEIEILVKNLDKEEKEIVILGDLNCNLSNQPNQPMCQKSENLLQIINLYQLHQLIKEPTRITPTSKTLIDLVITNKPSNYLRSGVIHIGISDHSMVYACRKISTPNNMHKFVTTRSLKNYDSHKFSENLKHHFENYKFDNTDPNELWGLWKSIFNDVLETYAPTRLRKVRSEYAPWLTGNLKKAMYHRDYLRKMAVKHNSPYFNEAYKRQRNKVNKDIKESKSAYYKNNITNNKSNPREMWRYVNQLTGKRSKTTNITNIDHNGSSIENKEEIVNLFNEYFSEIGKTLLEKIETSDLNYTNFLKQTESKFEFKSITVEEVLSELKNLKENKSFGPDNISPKFLKDSCYVIAPILTIIFNQSLKTGIFPDDWALARVSPIFKSGTKTEMGNYRPISVLSAVSKVFEKIICNQITAYFDHNNLFTKYQSGFRKGYSTMTSLLSVTNEWLCNIDKGLINGVLFLDIKKAFDTINHEILLTKLKYYGFQKQSLLWIKSYLKERKQFCKLNHNQSSVRSIHCGIPQGSNLGPLLFLIYVNDLPNCLEESSPSMFADDTNISVHGTSLDQISNKLNSEIDKVSNWLRANKLTLNTTKTEFMIIGSKHNLAKIERDPIILIRNNKIQRVRKTKSLGVIIDEKLDWKEHIDSISKKASKGIGALRLCKSFVPLDTLQILYNTIILPYFDYCCLVWDNCSITLKTNLQKLQNRAARIITGDSYDIRSKQVLEKLGWKTLEERRESKLKKYMSKVIEGDCPEVISNQFEKCNNKNYNLRSNCKLLRLSKPNTNSMKRSFSYKGAKVWNQQMNKNN